MNDCMVKMFVFFLPSNERIKRPSKHWTRVERTVYKPFVSGLFRKYCPLLGNLFYAFDINLRAAIALGVFGGGGIGYEIHMAMQMLRYQDVLALILFTIILISLFEKNSDALRKRIIGGEGLK